MLLSALVLLAGTLASQFLISRAGSCLCTSDQPCWPSADVFSQLESQLSQPLVYPLPTAYPCYPPSNPSGNCTDVVTNWSNGTWRSSLPGSTECPNWEAYTFPNGTIDSCFLNTTITGRCGQGEVPVIGVDARSVGDIQAAVGFAVKHGLKVVVKNTGHDFIGRSAAPNSFVVWTHNMNNITYDPAFVPQGAPEDETLEAITLGTGVQWQEAYAAANEYGRLMVGGGSPTVGAAGGWLAGGGHGPLSPIYGLGVDNTLEISIVLSTGEYLTTNRYQHPDLFWALCGGGGGTYGIMTSVTYRTYPMVPVQGWSQVSSATNSSVLLELVEGLLGRLTHFTDSGWSGYMVLSGQAITLIYYTQNIANQTTEAAMQEWKTFAESLAPYGVVTTDTVSYYSSWYDALQPLLDEGSVGTNAIYTSRLLSQDAIASNPSRIAQMLADCNAELNLVAGGRVSQIDADSCGLNPAWRNAAVHAVCPFVWDDSASSTEIQGILQQAKEWVQTMHDLSPNDGAYFNEASPFEIDWQQTYFGAHYPKLKGIKDKYDPYQLFVVRQGVGSEDWNNDLTCRNGS